MQGLCTKFASQCSHVNDFQYLVPSLPDMLNVLHTCKEKQSYTRPKTHPVNMRYLSMQCRAEGR